MKRKRKRWDGHQYVVQGDIADDQTAFASWLDEGVAQLLDCNVAKGRRWANGSVSVDRARGGWRRTVRRP